MRNFDLLVNPAAGQRAATGRGLQVAQHLRDAGARVTVTHTQSADHGCQVATEAAGRGNIVVAVGGDGTVGSLAGAVVATGATLGLVPVGRGNDFARQLGIPNDLAAVADLLLTGSVRSVDVIDVRGQIVVGSVYAGIDSLTSALVNRVHRLPTRLQYPVAAVWAIATHRATDYRIVIDGMAQSIDAHTVIVANSGYYGSGMHVAPSAQLDDGLLDIVIFSAAGRLRLLKALRRVYSGTHLQLPEVTVQTGRAVAIDAAGSVEAYADGDRIGPLPVGARVRPGALNVIAPSPRTG
ncbi:diacylglycerol/lipid kinase family protein [Cryobacterium suzukii]|uniref:diacylglycerol/lipid kinase family protein n=1 Tax=Cryobacterium suzukii TaxID=1259198 RepID=UPI0018E0AE4A|nr:diacylglycerol kinase family protein [Cryobacterium suzukii]